jgi:hypothetical protein
MNNKMDLRLTLSNENNDGNSLLQEINVLTTYLTSTNLDLTIEPVSNLIDANGTTKGDPFTLGTLLLVVSPALLPQLLGFIEKMTIDRRKIEIEAPNGAKIVFTPNKKMTEEEILAFLKKVNQIKKSK